MQSMIERFRKLPDDVDQLKELALHALARADLSETQARSNKTEAEALRRLTLSLTAKVEDLTQTNAAAKAEIDRLTSIIKTLRRDRFGKRSEKLGADEAEQQSFVFEEVETGLAAIDTRLAAKAASENPPPMDLPRQMISGWTWKYSQAPPQASLAPVLTSSMMSSAPLRRVISRSPCIYPSSGMQKAMFIMIGSTITAAISPLCS